MALSGNNVVRAFIACAITLQLYGLVYFNGLIFSTNRELLQELDQPQHFDKPETLINASDSGFHHEEEIKNREKSPEDFHATPNATAWSKVRNECFSSNSDAWVSGNISSNNAHGMTLELLDVLLEGPKDLLKLPMLLDQTICHPDSPLRNFSDNESSSLSTIEDWYHRFLYLALHWKFHRPALEEHQSRKKCNPVELKPFLGHHHIQLMDFECPEEKFLVIPIGSVGFGAFLNTQASLSILLALRTNRIPIFSSKSFFYWQKKGEMDPWLLAPSQCSRKDLQCYFLPMSPCTVTNEELKAAPVYGSDRKEQQYLAQHLAIPPELESNKIVVINSGLQNKARERPDMRAIASMVVDELLAEWKAASSTHQDFQDMDKAHQWITETIQQDPLGLLRQVYVYMLRPNPHYKKLLDRQMQELVPQPINPSETIGIPIRGSDKCKSESMCLPFDRYMELAKAMAHPELPNAMTTDRPKLIMTTEDPQVFSQSLVYRNNASFPFEILVNEKDNLQGSGYPREFSGEGESTIVSSLMALKFQFHASRVYLNCCSNFHLVLNYLLQGQCGAFRHGHDFVVNTTTTSNKVARCMNDEDTPRRFRICCGWSKKKGTCADIWKEYLLATEEKEQ